VPIFCPKRGEGAAGCRDRHGQRIGVTASHKRVLNGMDKIDCSTATLHEWVKKSELDIGKRAGLPSDAMEKMKALEWESREVRQANEILRKASAYFAMAELDCSFKR